MSDVVFILGAGCSKQCGAPLMADFLDTASTLYSRGEVREKTEHFERVFKAIGALQAVHSKSQLDLINIESVFTAFEVADTIGKLPGFSEEEISNVLSSLREVIVTTLEHSMKFPYSGSSTLTPFPYSNFTNLLDHIIRDSNPKHTVSIITFNYDIAADIALDNAGFGSDYGLETSSSSNAIPLLKLHGSLNWAKDSNSGNIVPLAIRDYRNKYHISPWEKTGNCSIPIGTHLTEYFSKYTDIKIESEPVIVPPTWNKAEYHQILSRVWGRAAKELEEAEYIFIIGYSLTETDSFFRLLYALGTVSNTPLRRIEVFNPDDSQSIRERYESIMGTGAKARYNFFKNTFAESIGIIHGYFPSRQ